MMTKHSLKGLGTHRPAGEVSTALHGIFVMKLEDLAANFMYVCCRGVLHMLISARAGGSEKWAPAKCRWQSATG